MLVKLRMLAPPVDEAAWVKATVQLLDANLGPEAGGIACQPEEISTWMTTRLTVALAELLLVCSFECGGFGSVGMAAVVALMRLPSVAAAAIVTDVGAVRVAFGVGKRDAGAAAGGGGLRLR